MANHLAVVNIAKTDSTGIELVYFHVYLNVSI